MRKSLVAMALAVAMLGIGESQQVRDRGYVESIAVSTDTNHVYASVRLYDDTITYKGIGDSLTTALTSAELRQSTAYFTGHTELLVLYDTPTLDTLTELLTIGVSPNCAVVLANSEVADTEYAYSVLKSYQRLGQLEILTVSKVARDLSLNRPVNVPTIYGDYSYTTTLIE